MSFNSEKINLSTGGFFYPSDSPLHKGYIEMKYPTLVEESILLSSNSYNKGTALNEFIKSLFINEFESVNVDDFLLVDLNSLIVDIRMLTYGPEHTVEIGDNQYTSLLTDLEFNKSKYKFFLDLSR